MDHTPTELTAELKGVSLILEYPRWVRWLVAATIAASILLALFPIAATAARIAENVEPQWGAAAFLLVGFGSSAAYLMRHFRGLSERVKISEELLIHGTTKIAWTDVTSVWDSAFFSMLRIRDRRGQTLTFFHGLRGYEALAIVAKEKKRANQAPDRTRLARLEIPGSPPRA